MSHASIVTRIARSVRWAFLESVLSAGAALGTVLVLARFVDPAEFGRAGIAVAVSAIVQALLLGGMPDALVRARSAHTGFTDAAFWAMTGLGAGAALLVAVAGIAVSVTDPRLGVLIAVQGLTSVAMGAAAAPTGVLLRKLRTRALVNRTAVSKLVGFVASAAFAVGGWGAWAVVLGNLCAQAAATIQLLATMRRPRFRLADPQLGETLRIGVLSGAQQGLGTLSTRGFVIAFGAVYGAHAVGLFNFALRLVEESCGLIITTLRRVTVTSFAAGKRAGLDLAPLFARGTSVIAYATAPLFLGGAAVAPDAVRLLFGPQWLGAVPALQLMLVLWVIRATRMLVNAIMVVDGRQRAMVLFGLAGLVATVVAFMASLPFGEQATTLAFGATLIGMVFGGRVFARATGIGAAAQLGAGAVPIALALAMAAAVTALRLGPLAHWDVAPRLVFEVAVGVSVFAGLALLVDRPGLARLARLARR